MQQPITLSLLALTVACAFAAPAMADDIPRDPDSGAEDQAEGRSEGQANDSSTFAQATTTSAPPQATTTSAPPQADKPYRTPSYDPSGGGFKLVDPVDPKSHPFALTISANFETRYFGFARSKDSTVDETGTVQPIQSLNEFEIARFMLTVSGFVGTPNIIFDMSLFGTTTGDPITLVGVVGYKFGEFLFLAVGVEKVPGTREWTESYHYHFGVDRSMITTFMRPNMSAGLYASGNLGKNAKYQAAIVNGVNGLTFNSTRPTKNFAYVFNGWWEPMGPYGPGFSDVEYHPRAAIRFGGSGTVAPRADVNDEVNGNPENTLFRLSDGTVLADPGALGPGVTVTTTDFYLATIDFGLKVRGTSLSLEYMFRSLADFRTTGGPPSRSSVFDYGGYLYLGHFVWPENIEIYGKTSYVSGPYGTGWEAGAGANWFIKGSRGQRLVFEVLYYDDNPADNDLTPYRAFYSGTAIQVEFWVSF
jgi:hypothetical protein